MTAMTNTVVLAAVLATFVSTGCRSREEQSALAVVLPASATASTTPARPVNSDSAWTARLRRLWAGERFDFNASSPSPDGRYVTEVDWSSGDLAVRDLTDGGLHRLTDKGDWQTSGDYALASTFSSGGDQVAYVWWNTKLQRHELRVLRFDVGASGVPRGSRVRTVHSSPGLQPQALFGWSADNRILVRMGRPDRTTALALVSAEPGDVRVLESFDWHTAHAARSPDGRIIAYDFPADQDTPERDIRLLSDDGASQATVVHGPADDVVLGWLPDGSGLLFASRQLGRSAMYLLSINAGEPRGPAALIRADLPGRVVPLGMTRATLYFGVVVESAELQIARSDGSDWRFSNASQVVDPYGGSTRAWDWAPDGSHFVHDARGPLGSGDFRIVVRSLDGESVRHFHLDGRAEVIRWGPDGQTICLYAWDRTNLPGLRALDLGSGAVRTIRRFEFEWQAMGGDFAVSPDGSWLYYRVLDSGAPVRRPTRGSIVRRNLATGVDRALHTVHWGGSLALSRDGRQLAFVDFDAAANAFTLNVMSAEGAQPREVFRQPAGATIHGVNWTPDGEAFVFLSGSPATPGTNQLVEISATGGEPRVLGEVPDLVSGEPRLSIDGRRIAYRAGRSRGEIWALDGLSPAGPGRPGNEGGAR